MAHTVLETVRFPTLLALLVFATNGAAQGTTKPAAALKPALTVRALSADEVKGRKDVSRSMSLIAGRLLNADPATPLAIANLRRHFGPFYRGSELSEIKL